MKRLIPLAIVAGLALAGCTAPPTAESASTVAPVSAIDTWEDEVFNEFLHDEGLTDIRDAVWPVNLVTGYESTGDGVITLYVNNEVANQFEPTVFPYDPEDSLDTIVGAMMDVTGGNRPELEKIIAVSENGKYQAEQLNYSFS